MNRQQLRQCILYAANENITAPVSLSIAQVDTMIQEGLEILVEEITDLRREAFITVEPGRFLYTLGEIAPDVMGISRIWDERREQRLEVTSIGELDDARDKWLSIGSGDPRWWFPVSWDAFGLYPGPVAGGGLLRVDYVAWPTLLQSDFDSPQLADTEQDLLVMYGQYDSLIRQWEFERAEDIFTVFVQAFRDQTFKRETRRFAHLRAARQLGAGAFPEG